ncbi:MAG: L-2-amino-thiazoline-4-carboxylic acid hydrolase [Rubrivivax sp.]
MTTATAPTDREQALIDQLRDAFKSRAMVYAAMYEEMKAEFGADKAREVCKRAIYKRGEAIAHHFAPCAPADLAGLRDRFLAFIPQAPHLFQPEVVQCTDQELEIQFHRCPLKEAARRRLRRRHHRHAVRHRRRGRLRHLREGRLLDHLGHGQPGRGGCCRLHIRPGPPQA